MAGLAVAITAALLLPRALGIRTMPLPAGEAPSFDVGDLEAALKAGVRAEGVDYDALTKERAPLLRFVHAISSYGPTTDEEAFASDELKLAYYLNAYNALVLYGVLLHQPISSVHDVRGSLEITPGFGFFWGLKFQLDGKRVNLYDFENKVIRSFGDARIHAAINCASRSCPPLRENPFSATSLDEELRSAARSWVGRDEAVQITKEAIVLSSIFDWFGSDFEEHAKSLGLGHDVLDWVGHHLSPEKLAMLKAARSEALPVVFRPYDWSLNKAVPD